MLAVTVKENGSVLIGSVGNPLGFIRVSAVKCGKVRLALHFPQHVELLREEVVREIVGGHAAPRAVSLLVGDMLKIGGRTRELAAVGASPCD